MILFTSLYDPLDASRKEEFLYCLDKMLDNLKESSMNWLNLVRWVLQSLMREFKKKRKSCDIVCNDPVRGSLY